MKKLASVFTVLLALSMAVLFSLPACAEESSSLPDTSRAIAACVYNLESDQVLYSQKSDEPVYPASTVKLMTALLALEHYADALDTEITVTKEHLKDVGGTRIGFAVGEKLTAEQLITALIVSNANDAAAILAHSVSGSVGDFVTAMNRRAKEIGAEHTVYTNASGVHDPQMHTTLSDTLLIAKTVYKNNRFMEIAGAALSVIPRTNKSGERTLYNRNAFLSSYYLRGYRYSAVTGMNAGSTGAGGYCVVASARSENTGLSYFAIVMGADADENEIYSYRIARDLLDYAFDGFSFRTVLDPAKIICEIPVLLSDTTDHTILTPAEEVELFLPVDVDITAEVTTTYTLKTAALTAPISAGQVAGTVTVHYGGKEMASVDLVTKTAIERSRTQELQNKITAFFTSQWFYIGLAIAIVAAIVFVFAKAVYRERKKQALEIRRRK